VVTTILRLTIDDIHIDYNSTVEKSNGVAATQTIFVKPFFDVLKIEVFTWSKLLTLARMHVYSIRHVWSCFCFYHFQSWLQYICKTH